MHVSFRRRHDRQRRTSLFAKGRERRALALLIPGDAKIQVSASWLALMLFSDPRK
ncbi:hypothetical protein [Bradyrhizobium sp. YR681]|uniref:hypothetical protein n=1 Tax=Bradyrhizobium sp. YR681 TaxID=1144344 RepID=UPI0002D2F4E6|nr:hypothetical protein [Bradyrhizobium sp. YR681]